MLQEAKDLQRSAVTKLVSIVHEKDEFTFKAPTGSGKTFMMADFMNRILSNNENIVFLVSSLSSSNLAEQNYNSFMLLSQNGTFPKLNPYLTNSVEKGEGSLFIPTDYNVYVLPRDLYKKKSKLKEEGTLLHFLQTMTDKIFEQSKGKTLYLIKDECHQATNNLDELKHYFAKVFNFSATPKLSRKQHPDVEISNLEAETCKIIKTVELGSNEDTLEDALAKYSQVKKDYRNLLKVNPAFIIQISNKDKAEQELQKTIMPALAKYQDLKWVYISGEAKEFKTKDSGLVKLKTEKWKDYLKEKSSTISVIIFKMVIKEGYDIPRACMLYQIRDSKSTQLDEQVMGRVRRNPRLLDFETLCEQAKHLAMTAWIWGIVPKQESTSQQVVLAKNYNIEHSIKIKSTTLNITQVKKRNLEKFIASLNDVSSQLDKKPITNTSIFTLYKMLTSQDEAIQSLCYQYADSFEKWRTFTENLSNIKATYESYICDYEKSMVVNDEVSFPVSSCYTESEKNLTLEDWIWCRKDNENDFSFDSDAEKKWAEVLKDIRSTSIDETATVTSEQSSLGFDLDAKRFLWGKNFPYNSEIKFEYYLDGVHSSYPDFIMKDKQGRVHIFEVKSVNKSATHHINEEEYIAKVNALKKCYQAASKKTGHLFYLPVLEGSKWQITRFANGTESVISKAQFKHEMQQSAIYKIDENLGEMHAAETH